ncbi:aryl hydrocarbon receptor protein 1 [Chrysoperla carnea]|uniref:aryl hydrocarbon receptor protein 1 n=1 Tax=Chrysoperla carnea TaxID=189513 RepID=UPI001D07D104|nr:aryl hydrocarbon receptor protein 1 [Chrysoperla carnea]
MHKDKEDSGNIHRNRELTAFDHTVLDGEMFLQALNGFLMILTCEGEVFFATHSIEGYLGFHQSDIVHQSVYELVHSEDREELQRQLMWNSFLPAEQAGISLQEALQPDAAHLLERSFTVRFRCLLDNTSGFLRLDIRGRVKILHGQNRKSEEPPLALFAICTPFGPPSLLEIPQKEVMFKSKHKLDLSLVSMDQRGKMLLGYSDSELANMGGYDLVHYDDLAYVASAHQELLKTGASGMIAYRFQTKEGQWQWLQTSSRLVYKNSKPDFVISTHRPLMEEEGRDLLGKRTMDFKVSYLDAGLTNSYFTEQDQLVSTNSPSTSNQHSNSTTPPRVNRRYKTQLRDFLSTCRTKRKLSTASSSTTSNGQITPTNITAIPPPTPIPNPMPTVDYLAPDAAAAAAYNMYTGSYTTPTADVNHGLTSYSANFQHSLYPATAGYATTDNLYHQYRPLTSYYPEFHHTTATPAYNGFLDPRGTTCAVPTYDVATPTSHHSPYQIPSRTAVMPVGVDDKLYSCQQVVDPTSNKYATYVDSSRGYVVTATAPPNNKCIDVSWPYSVSPSSGIIQPVQVMTPPLTTDNQTHKNKYHQKTSPISVDNNIGNVTTIHNDHSISPVTKMEDASPQYHTQQHYSPHHHPHHHSHHHHHQEVIPRQTVLMWGSGGSNHNIQQHSSSNSSCNSRSPPSHPNTPNVIVNNDMGVTNNHHQHIPPPPQISQPQPPSQLHHHHDGSSTVWQTVGDIVKPEPPSAVVANNISPGPSDSPEIHQSNHAQQHQGGRVVMVL